MTGPQRRSHAKPAVDASMGLLNELMYRPVDASYAEAARHPVADLGPGERARRTVVHLVVAVALGLVTVTAILSLRTPQPSALEGRALLQGQIADRSEHAEQLRQGNDELSAEIIRLQSEALAVADPDLIERLRQVELVSGAVAVQGPGLVIELDDAGPGPAPVDPRSRVQDLDLQIVTNALWAAGAESIAINGQRLTALSAIRGAGEAILVDLQPLVGPYRVEAIGDVRAMQTEFARSTAANHLTMLSGTFGVQVSVRADSGLVLPGAGSRELRYASVLGAQTDDDVASSPPPGDGEGS